MRLTEVIRQSKIPSVWTAQRQFAFATMAIEGLGGGAARRRFKTAGEYLKYNVLEGPLATKRRTNNNLINAEGDLCLWEAGLESLEGCPPKTEGDFYCNSNHLTSLKGCPSVIGTMNGGGEFDMTNNQITNLHDVHKLVKKMGSTFALGRNPIKSHVLGLLLIDGLMQINTGEDGGADYPALTPEWVNILNNYLPNKKGMESVYDCQTALIEAGLEEYAQL